jgi:hypothetical protein
MCVVSRALPAVAVVQALHSCHAGLSVYVEFVQQEQQQRKRPQEVPVEVVGAKEKGKDKGEPALVLTQDFYEQVRLLFTRVRAFARCVGVVVGVQVQVPAGLGKCRSCSSAQCAECSSTCSLTWCTHIQAAWVWWYVCMCDLAERGKCSPCLCICTMNLHGLLDVMYVIIQLLDASLINLVSWRWC